MKPSRQELLLVNRAIARLRAGIVATDLDGKVLHLNPAGARILAITDTEAFLNSKIEDVILLDEQSWALLKTRARTRSVVRLEGEGVDDQLPLVVRGASGAELVVHHGGLERR